MALQQAGLDCKTAFWENENGGYLRPESPKAAEAFQVSILLLRWRMHSRTMPPNPDDMHDLIISTKIGIDYVSPQQYLQDVNTYSLSE